MNPNTLTPNIVLGVAAHPDDLDFYAGGTMAAFAKAGADVYYLTLTDGGKGTDDRTMKPETLRDTRRNEQRTAGKILGLKDVFFCDFPDGTLENKHDVQREIVKTIRRVKPDVVVTLDPTVVYIAEQGLVNHPDHRAAGQAALDAVYPLARDHMSFPELLAEGYEPHKTKTILLVTFDPARGNYAADISDEFDLKLQAISAHASQFSDREQTQTRLREYSATTGKAHNYTYAEPFVRIDIA